MKKVFALIGIAGLLLGCSGPKYNTKVLCEVRSGDRSLQFVQYEQNDYPDLPQFGGHSVRGGVLFKDGKNRGNNRSFMNGLVEDWVEYAKDACKGSSIEGDNIVIHPVHRHYKATEQKLRRNRVVISTDGGRDFNLLELPEFGPPFLVDRKDEHLAYSRWITKSINLVQGAINLEQVTILAAPFDFNGKKTGRGIWPWLELRGGGCEECEPLLARTVISSDGGLSWRVEKFNIIKPEIMPPDAVLPLSNRRLYWDDRVGSSTKDKLIECPADPSALKPWPRKICTLSDSTVIHLD